MKPNEVNRRIERLGGRQTRQVGSHRRYAANFAKPDGGSATAYTTVPQHAGSDIPLGTLKAIEKDLEPAFGKGWLTR